MRAHPIAVTMLAALGMGALHGCGRAQRQAGPDGVLIDSVVLHETELAHLGRPESLVVGQDGSLFIADAMFRRVYQYDAAGSLVRIWGQSGSAGGELAGVGSLNVTDRGLIVTDVYRDRLLIFKPGEPEPVTAVQLPPGVPTTAAVDSEGVWIGLLNRQHLTGIAHWTYSGNLRLLVPWPPAYIKFPALASIFDGVAVVPSRDTILVGFMGSDRIDVYSREGRWYAGAIVPAVRRRGAPSRAVTRFTGGSFPELLGSISGLFEASRTANGTYVLVHLDQNASGPLVTGKVFVSLISSRLRRACVDGEIVDSHQSAPVPYVRHDTLWVLEQQLVKGAAHTVVREYRISGEHCAWRATVPAPPAAARM